MDFGGGDEAEGNQLGGFTVDRLSGIPHIISTNNFLSSEDSEEGEREERVRKTRKRVSRTTTNKSR